MNDSAPFHVRIETPEDRGRRRLHAAPKGRSFGAQMICCQMAHGYWDKSERDPLRPTFALFLTSRQEAGPFLANLRKGKRLRADGIGFTSKNGWPVEFLKSEDYGVNVQNVDGEELTFIEVFFRPLFEFKPSLHDPDEVRFLLSLPLDRLRHEAAALDRTGLDALLRGTVFPAPRNWYDGKPYDPDTVLAEGVRFAAALNERGMLPIPPEPVFCVRLLLSALQRGFALRNQRAGISFSPDAHDAVFMETGMALAKRAPGLAFAAKQSQIGEWLASEVMDWDRWKRSIGHSVSARHR